MVDLATASPFDPSNLRSLAGLKLPERLTFRRFGADESVLRIARLLLFPSSAAAAEKGRVPLPLADELAVMRALAAVAKLASARIAPSGVGFAEPAALPKKSKKKSKKGGGSGDGGGGRGGDGGDVPLRKERVAPRLGGCAARARAGTLHTIQCVY